MKIVLPDSAIREINTFESWSDLMKTDAHANYDTLYSAIFLSHICNNNFQELVNYLALFESIDTVQKHLFEKRISKTEFITATRLFINYIASAIALRDSTRNICKKTELFPLELAEIAQSRIGKDILPNKSIKLIEDIRNIITHQTLPIPVISFAYENNTLHVGYSYKIDGLLRYERLSNTSKLFLKESKEKYIFLKPLINEYHNVISRHQNWVITESLSRHKSMNSLYWEVRNQVSHEWGGDLEIP